MRNKALRMALGMLETGNWLSFRLWLQDRHRVRSLPGLILRSYMSLGGRGPWRSADLFTLLPEAAGCRVVLEHHPGDGIFTPVEELAYLALIARALEPKLVFEIGTYRGRTALNFALNTPDDAEIITLDLPPEDKPSVVGQTNGADANLIQASRPGLLFAGRPEAANIRQLLGNSLTFDFSPYADRAGLVFVDGAHHYAAARSDTENALRMVRPGGMIVWHDWGNYGDYHDVMQAVLDVLPGDQVFQIAATQLAVYRRPL